MGISTENQKHHLRILPPQGWIPVSFTELWGYRDLLYYLVLRDMRSTTHATRLGFYWVLLQPLATAAIISIVMGFLVKVPTDGVPYPIVVLSGLLIWGYVSNVVMRSSTSMIANAYLLTKVYFPRIIIPLVPSIAGLIDMAIHLFVITACCLYYQILPQSSWLILPFTMALAISIALGTGLWVSSLTVRFRDFGNIIPVILQLGMYLSPVFYPSSIVPERWRWLYDINPMVGIIDVTRDAIIGQGDVQFVSLVYPMEIAFFLLISGIFYFRVSEDVASDLV